jgi:hypothetical protein
MGSSIYLKKENSYYITISKSDDFIRNRPLQNPALSILAAEGVTSYDNNKTLDHRSQGVRNCAEGCMALRW